MKISARHHIASIAFAACCAAVPFSASAQPNNAVPAVPTLKPTTKALTPAEARAEPMPAEVWSERAVTPQAGSRPVVTPQISVQVGRTPSAPGPDSAASATPPSGVDDRAARCLAADAQTPECRDAAVRAAPRGIPPAAPPTTQPTAPLTTPPAR